LNRADVESICDSGRVGDVAVVGLQESVEVIVVVLAQESKSGKLIGGSSVGRTNCFATVSESDSRSKNCSRCVCADNTSSSSKGYSEISLAVVNYRRLSSSINGTI